MTRREFIQLIGIVGAAALAVGAVGAATLAQPSPPSAMRPGSGNRPRRAAFHIHGKAPAGCAAADHHAESPPHKIAQV